LAVQDPWLTPKRLLLVHLPQFTFAATALLSPRTVGPANPELANTLEEVKTPQDAAKLPFFARAMLASAAAWSPNPKNSPLILTCR
jgi:hypothetical protein